MNIDLMRRSGGIRRYHNRPIIGEQTVATHCWGVITILYIICSPSNSLVYAATFHDTPEVLTGDIPADAKAMWPAFKEAETKAELDAHRRIGLQTVDLTNEEKVLLKAADILEGLWFCLDQRRLGNTALDEVWANYEVYFLTLCQKHRAILHQAIVLYSDLKDRRDGLFPDEPSSS